MSEIAIRRNPQEGMAHQVSSAWNVAMCGSFLGDDDVFVRLADVATKDRCKRCWPTTTPVPAAARDTNRPEGHA